MTDSCLEESEPLPTLASSRFVRPLGPAPRPRQLVELAIQSLESAQRFGQGDNDPESGRRRKPPSLQVGSARPFARGSFARQLVSGPIKGSQLSLEASPKWHPSSVPKLALVPSSTAIAVPSIMGKSMGYGSRRVPPPSGPTTPPSTIRCPPSSVRPPKDTETRSHRRVINGRSCSPAPPSALA